MAQKFGNSRWVHEGFLDNRQTGTVIGRVTFAWLGPVDFYLVGNARGEAAGHVIRFRNSRFADEDLAGQALPPHRPKHCRGHKQQLPGEERHRVRCAGVVLETNHMGGKGPGTPQGQ